MMGGPPPPEFRFVRVVGPTGRSRDAPFMLDTGADIGIIPRAMAYYLELPELGQDHVTGVSGTNAQEIVGAQLYVEGLGPFDVEMIVSPSTAALGRDVIAQIGMSIPGAMEPGEG